MTSGEDKLLDVRVSEIKPVARDINLYQLKAINPIALPEGNAGSHIDLHLANGLVRQYSLVLDDDKQDYVVAVKRDQASRGGSTFIHQQIHVGTTLRISEPRNHFLLDENAPYIVLIAGGIGITPIYSMIHRLRQLGRPWELHYASRSRAEMAFLAELSVMPEANRHFDDESGGTFLDIAKIVKNASSDAHFYCCGPMPLMDAFETAAASVPEGKKHVEYFAAKEAPSRHGGFTIRLAKSGKTFVVRSGESILDVITAAGINVEHSCTEGICGTCETRVLAGIPDHRDSILTDEERVSNKTMMICCSGSLSDELLLDL
jgi:tetrachlorobenzoquinone reductase